MLASTLPAPREPPAARQALSCFRMRTTKWVARAAGLPVVIGTPPREPIDGGALLAYS